MTEPADAAMHAIEEYLSDPEANATDFSPAAAEARSSALTVVIEAFRGTEHQHCDKAVLDALDTLAAVYDYMIAPDDGYREDEGDVPEFDLSELDDALHFARRGMVGDVLHHLARALPAEYAPITDALVALARTRP